MKGRDRPMASKDLHGPNKGEARRAVVAKDSGAKPRIGGSRGLDVRSQEAIGRSLKAHYEDLVRAPVPDKFLEMLDRLEAAERSKPQGAADESE
jgi:Anti-sigma factor NepR